MYLCSDFVFLILYYLVGYRKKVVLKNLRNAFPEKSEQEIHVICKKFYHYFCDLIFEVFKVSTISKKSMIKRCKFSPECFAIFSKFAEEGRSVIIAMGHLGNWEWAGHPFSLLCKQQLNVIYHPVKNKYFDRMMIGMRSRFGTKMIPMNTAFKEMLAHKNELTSTVFITDQTPMPEKAYWTTFLSQDTPVFRGTEAIAKKLDLPVVYAAIIRKKRGYYEMIGEVLTDKPTTTGDGEITEMHTRRLEKDIIAQPETWLWTHRRWKYERKP